MASARAVPHTAPESTGVTGQDRPLNRRAVHRVLLGRLAIAVVSIAAVLAALVYALERRALEQRFIDRAVAGATQFIGDAGALLSGGGAENSAALQERLDAFARAPRLPLPEGRMVAVIILDAASAVAARFVAPDYPLRAEASATLEAVRSPVDLSAAAAGRSMSVANVEHILVRIPLLATDGRPIGQATGLFALSPPYLAQQRRLLWMTVIAAVVIVLLTAAVLYPIIARLLRRLERASVGLLDANLDMLRVIGSAIAKRDADTDVHNYRVTLYAVRLAEALDLDATAVRGLIKGAFLHDVGKIGTPDRILLKPGRLTDEEFNEMKQHVAHGCEIVARSAWLADAAPVVGGHHEKFDGSGYAGALCGDAIPLAARIFAIVDVYDALTSQRPYKAPLPYDAAMAILEQGRGKHFDPRLLDVFAGIARPLFDQFANRDDEHPRQALAEIVERYFRRDLEAFLN